MLKKTIIILLFILFLVSCEKDNVFDPYSDPKLWAPQDLSISAIAYDNIKLSWTKSNFAVDGYKISRKLADNTWEEEIAVLSEDTNSWIDINANLGIIYTYKVCAYRKDKISSYIVQEKDFRFLTPSNLSITPNTANSIKLTWFDANQYVQGYKISRKIADEQWHDNIATVDANMFSYLDENADYGNTYTYRIVAFAGENQSNPLENTVNFVLAPPINFYIRPQSASALKLSWTDTNHFEQGYKISRKTEDDKWEQVAILETDSCEWIDEDAYFGTNYTYRIAAFAGENYSYPAENSASFTLSTPTNLSIIPYSASSMQINWEYPNQFAEGFKISRKIAAGEWQDNIATVPIDSLSWIDNNAPFGTAYTYKVHAYAGENLSDPIECTDEFLLSSPQNLIATINSPSSLKLIWEDANTYNEGFIISRKYDDNDWEESFAKVAANTKEWIDDAFESSKIYQYKVKAFNQNYYSDFSNTTTVDLSQYAFVEGGRFEMGSLYGEENEVPVHTVSVSSFFISKFAVSQALWQSVMQGNYNFISAYPSYFAGNPDSPVERISWYEAIVFCNRKSIQEGLTPCYSLNGNTDTDSWGIAPNSTDIEWNSIACNWSANGYRLPTESEWEYAAKGGIYSKEFEYSGSNDIDEVAWYSENSDAHTHDNGKKKSNELDIYDMSGNIREWVWDWYSPYTKGDQVNPTGPNNGTIHIHRGGCWYLNENSCRTARRNGSTPAYRDSGLGLRLVKPIR